ncbi:MAG: isochorismatase family protein [Gemmatimonadaceae bacterium]
MRSSSDAARPRIGYLVDLQEDFMRAGAPGGRLYVKHLADPADVGTEQIIPQLRRLARWMADECDAVVYTRDAHRLVDPEISSAAPDFVNTYPVHCAAYSDDAAERAGAAIIPEVAPSMPMLTLYRDATDDDAVAVAMNAVRDGLPVLVEKSRFSVWIGNRAMGAFVAALEAALGARPEIIACGVASDVCVAQGIDGFLERGYPVTVVRDAIYSLSGDDDARLSGWATRGATITTVDELCGPVDTTVRQAAESGSTEERR